MLFFGPAAARHGELHCVLIGCVARDSNIIHSGDGFLVDLEDINSGPPMNDILERDLAPALYNGKHLGKNM